jgi:hypothetical protein
MKRNTFRHIADAAKKALEDSEGIGRIPAREDHQEDATWIAELAGDGLKKPEKGSGRTIETFSFSPKPAAA